MFLKEPVPGNVKTRLGAQIGHEKACAVYRHLVKATFKGLSPTTAKVRILFDPPEAEERIRNWLEPVLSDPEATEWEAQSAGDLGDRLGAAFHSGFQSGAERIVVVGTDCPAIQASHYEDSFAQLEGGEADVVIGPAGDGGYYLLALGKPCPGLFQNIPWSSKDTLGATLAGAGEAGLKVGLLEILEDIDDEVTLKRARAEGHL